MSEPLRYTPRGFAVYADFTDRYDAHVWLVESSFAPEPCVWIFVTDGATEGNDGAAHLTMPMAIVVRDALDAWIEQQQRSDDDQDSRRDA